MQLKPITDKRFYIDHIDWIKEIDFSDMTYADCLERCLTGQYKGIAGYIDEIPKSILIYYIYDINKCWAVGMWAKNNYKTFAEKTFDMLKRNGVSIIRCSSTRKYFRELTKFKEIHTVFERVL